MESTMGPLNKSLAPGAWRYLDACHALAESPRIQVNTRTTKHDYQKYMKEIELFSLNLGSHRLKFLALNTVSEGFCQNLRTTYEK